MPKKRTSEMDAKTQNEEDKPQQPEQQQQRKCGNNENEIDNQQPSTSTAEAAAASSSITNNMMVNKSTQNIFGGTNVAAFQIMGTANISTHSADPASQQPQLQGEEMDSSSYSDTESETSNSRGENFIQSVNINTNEFQPTQTVYAENSHFVNVVQNVKMPSPPRTSLKGLGNLPYPPAIFTGRVQFLKDLKKKLKDRETASNDQPISRLVVIKGSGGIGKSSVAKKYAQSNSTRYHGNIAWIDAENRASATESFVRLARNLKIDQYDQLCKSAVADINKEDCFKNFKNLVNGVYAHLNKHGAEFKKALFILDNAQQLQDARAPNGEFLFGMDNCLPTKGQFSFLPVFLATSRIIEWARPGDGVEKVDLDKFSMGESHEYLLQVCNNDGWSSAHKLMEEDVEPLAEILDGCPLALELAAAAISSEWDESTLKRDKKRNIQIYMADFHEDGRKWASREIPVTCSKEYDKILSNVWEGTIRRIKGYERVGDLALSLLKISSFLPTDFISSRLLHFIHKKIVITRRSKGDLSVENSEVQLTISALKLLKKFSMIKMDNMLNIDEDENADFFDSNFFYDDKGSGKIYIHRLVQKMERVKFTIPDKSKVTRGQQQGQDHLALLPAFPQPPPPHYTKVDLGDLSDLLLFIRQNTVFFQRTGRFPQILHNLKDSKWPGQSYRDYVTSCFSGLTFEVGAFHTRNEEKLVHVKGVYDFLVGQPDSDNDRDEEFLVMCKLFLMHLHHYELIARPFRLYHSMSDLEKTAFKNSLQLEVKMDNSAIFRRDDELIEISLGQFLHWLLDKACLYIHNPWFQGEAIDIYEDLNRQLQPALLSKDGLHDKLLKWFKFHQNEVLNRKLNPNSPSLLSSNYDYQINFESKEKNLQWTSNNLFRLVAPLLTLELAVAAITRTMNNRKHQLQSGHTQDVFNCWEYFEYCLNHLPGFPWSLWSQHQRESELDLLTNVTNFTFMSENQRLVKQMGEILQNYVQDYSTMKAMREKEKKAKKTDSNHLYTPECEENYVELKEHKGNLIYPKYTIDVIRILSCFDGVVKNMISLNPSLPLALKNTLTCFIDHCTAHMSVDIHLHDVILTWLAVLPHVPSSPSVELWPLKDFVMTSEEQTNCKNIFQAEIKRINRQTRENSFTPSNYEPLSREEATKTRKRIIYKFNKFSRISPKETRHFFSSWTPLVQHLEELEKELNGAMNAYEELEQRNKELYQNNLNSLEEETSELADFIA